MKQESKQKEIVLNEQLEANELEQLKGGVTQSTVALMDEEEIAPVEKGTSNCCNW